MDARWVGEPAETSLAPDAMAYSWLPLPQWDKQSMPPCARCGSAFAAHRDGDCPPAEYAAPTRRAHWPRRHPLLSGAILVAALLAGVGVGTASVSHVNYATGNGKACLAYWQISNSDYAMLSPPGADGWHHLKVAMPGITDPELSAAVKSYNEDLFYADLPDAQTMGITTIAGSCNALGYSNPG
jgi:hypothetical protein